MIQPGRSTGLKPPMFSRTGWSKTEKQGREKPEWWRFVASENEKRGNK